MQVRGAFSDIVPSASGVLGAELLLHLILHSGQGWDLHWAKLLGPSLGDILTSDLHGNSFLRSELK